MPHTTTQCAKEIITGLSRIDGLTAEQMLEIIKELRLAIMLYPAEEQRDGMIRATCMLENYLTIQKILG
jgi:hypothetical protein